jgi:hypothetical protein
MSAYITHICPDIISVHTDVPWRGHLHKIRSDIAKSIPTLTDVTTALELELKVATRSCNWVATCLLVYQLNSYLDM